MSDAAAYRTFAHAAKARKGSEEWTLDRYLLIFAARADGGRAKAAGRCFYCHGSVKVSAGYHVDRINSNVGYTWDNVVPCCAPCNRIKNNMPPMLFDQFMSDLRARWPDGIPWATVGWDAFRWNTEPLRDTQNQVAPERQLSLVASP